jgi:SAM-dependent methyltransferase
MCDGGRLAPVMSLTPTPPGNTLLDAEQLELPPRRYPLDLNFCLDCTHVQLRHVVDPHILYQNRYLYVSGTSAQFVSHLRAYAGEMVRRFELGPGSLVADVGSNDGTCLRGFRDLGMRVVGVDPATEIAARATVEGIETVGAFFSRSVAGQLREQYGPAAFVTSHNACAHIDDLRDVVAGVADWLGDDGVFGVEVGYFVDVVTKLQFDTIYHEHLDYHTAAPFRQLLARSGLELISAERVAPQGGSIRLLAQKAGGRFVPDGSVEDLVGVERALGLDRPETISAFGERIRALGERLRASLASIKAAGKTIAGYGAPTKAITLLSHFGIGAESLDFVVEDNPMKHGLYLPISHIPVVPTDELYRRRPDYVLILAWNFAEPIMAMHSRYAAEGGRFILPMPEPTIV